MLDHHKAMRASKGVERQRDDSERETHCSSPERSVPFFELCDALPRGKKSTMQFVRTHEDFQARYQRAGETALRPLVPRSDACTDIETDYGSALEEIPLRSRAGEYFKTLPAEALDDFESIESLSSVTAGTILFMEEQTPSDIFILLKGQVKLTINSSEGKRLILRIAHAGEFLGLTSAFTGHPHTTTAEAIYPCMIAAIRREDFLKFLCRHPAVYPCVARDLSLDCNQARSRLRTIGLASSARAKFARLLLEWCADGRQTEHGIRLRLSLTHAEIAEFIGVTRETVTRNLIAFKHRQMIAQHGSFLTISNRPELEKCASSGRRDVIPDDQLETDVFASAFMTNVEHQAAPCLQRLSA